MRNILLTYSLLSLIGLAILPLSAAAGGKSNGFNNYDWTEVNARAPWVARAGLEAVVLDGDLTVAPSNGPIPVPST